MTDISKVLDAIASLGRSLPNNLAPGETHTFRVESDGIGGLWVWETHSGRIWAELDDEGRVVDIVDYLKVDFPVDLEAAKRWEARRVELRHPDSLPLPVDPAPSLEPPTMEELTKPFGDDT